MIPDLSEVKAAVIPVEPETAFIGKKFAYIFLGIIFSLNAITFIWFFLFSNLK